MNTQQREEVLAWLQTNECWELGELEYELAFEYDVLYESKGSYYDLFDAAGITWKKTSSANPKANEEALAAKKRDFIIVGELLRRYRSWAIESFTIR